MRECGLPALVKKSNETILNWIENVFDKKSSKNFIHFDIAKKFEKPQDKINFFEAFLSEKNIENHNFFPLIRYLISENKVKLEENEDFFRTTKDRPITYASHQDSCIYSYYSFILQDYYDEIINEHNLGNSILAYRAIKDNKGKGKNNIHFAKEAFRDISDLKNCYVVALDISKFFDTLDHTTLKLKLQKILKVKKLDNNWYKVFRSLTKFSYIETKILGNLNLIKKIGTHKKIVDLERFNLLKKQGKKQGKKIIEENTGKKGIPQGTAISGMLANLYMIDFDIWINDYITSLGGKYYRYSDDLLLIIPSDKDSNHLQCETIINKVEKEIDKQLLVEINTKKTEICLFKEGVIVNKPIKITGRKIKKSIQYLGFDFNGERVLIRNKTLSNFYKKMIHNIKRLSHLNNGGKGKTPHFKGNKILTGKLNRKFLYNGKKSGGRYILDKEESRWKVDSSSKSYYLGFISYGYTAFDEFETFCNTYNLTNGIKKQLTKHRNIYKKYLKKKNII